MPARETEPTISIVVPVRNGEGTIESLLQSLAGLDYDERKVEVIIVDGDSTDKTRDIVKRYPFKMVVEDKDGINVARNTGVESSTGDIIAFTDCDCIVSSDWAQRIAENFNDPQIGCVAGNVKGYYSNFFSKYADNSIVPVMPSFKARQQMNKIKLFRHPAGCNIAFRREALEKIGCFDEDIRYGFDDLELVERVCNSGYKLVCDPKVVIRHKHRASLKELLEQHFKYGKGSGILLKKRTTKERFSIFSLLNLVGFITWISLIGVFTFLTISTGYAIVALVLLGIIFLPLLIDAVYYAHGARRKGQYGRAIVYPFIDLLRTLAFCAGQICQLFKSDEKHQES